MPQLVHGRSDVMLRSANTMTALESMATWGYVGRDDASTLAQAYRFLRTMEHRLQLYRMQRTHMVPDDDQALRRLGRSMGFRTDSKQELIDPVAATPVSRSAVCIEKLFYRPLLNAVARLDSGDAGSASRRPVNELTALGYLDPQGAIRHLEALSSGISRRAARSSARFCPVLLGWFADALNPDAGLLGFRRVRPRLGGTPGTCDCCGRIGDRRAFGSFAVGIPLCDGSAAAGLRRQSRCSAMSMIWPRKSQEDLLREMSATAQRYDEPDLRHANHSSGAGRELFRVTAADINGLLGVPRVRCPQRYFGCHDHHDVVDRDHRRLSRPRRTTADAVRRDRDGSP